MDTPLLNDFLKMFPASYFCKNKDGVYLSGNNYLKSKMQCVGIRFTSLIGRSDFSVFPKDIANKIRHNDMEAMENKQGIVRYEKLILNKGGKVKEAIFLSSKKPVFNSSGEVCGIAGISIDVTDHYDSSPTASLTTHTLFLTNVISPSILSLAGKWQNTHLTFRQAQCAYLLCLGKTNLQIANELGLSVRTVEDHILQLRIKFDCAKRSNLIEVLVIEIGMPTIVNFIKQ